MSNIQPQKSVTWCQIVSPLTTQYKQSMRKLLVLLLVAYISYSQTVAKSDTSNLILGLPATIIPGSFPVNFLPGSSAIWNLLGNVSPPGMVVTFNKMIHLSCGGPLKLSIAAFGTYVIWWDGVNVGTGANSNSLATFALATKCGQHNLTIVVTRTGGILSPSGLIYGLVQDQSACYNCNGNGIWNDYTCACQCLQGNTCPCPTVPGTTTPKVWAAYPACACNCPKTLICPAGQYFNQNTCTCLCRVQYCPPKQTYNVDPKMWGGCGCIALPS